MQLQAGSFLRDYEIQKLLGKGGMGTVYLAKDSFLDRRVAIKELSPHLTADAGLVERFRNEARLQAKLNHSNIVSLHNFFEQSGRYYMVMEYADGKTLKEIINQIGPIHEERALNILKQIVLALNFAQNKDIIHRDIKPSNIIVNVNDEVKILDFGIARIMGERGLTQTGQQLGTIAYMSPEQVKALKDIDGKTDVYSLGITLFEMLSGRMPYDLDTQSDYEVMDSIVRESLPDPRDYYPHISDKTMGLLAGMTEKDRQRRLGIADLVAHFEGDLSIAPSYKTPTYERTKIESVIRNEVHNSPVSNESLWETIKKKTHTKLILITAVILIIVIMFIRIGNPQSKNNSEFSQKKVVRAQEYEETPIEEPYHSEEPYRGEERAYVDNKILFEADEEPVIIEEKKVMSKVTIPMIFVDGGSFMMGSNNADNDAEKPAHEVSLSSFWIGKYEVTKKEWNEVMDTDSAGAYGYDQPISKIQWYDAIAFCNTLSLRNGLTPCYSGSGKNISCNWNANGYRLPTEAEWEYAARGGKDSRGYRYAGSNTLTEVAWCYENSSTNYGHKPVGQKKANELGIYDMSGNADEWCWDWFDDSYYRNSPQRNPRGPSSGSRRAIRGSHYMTPQLFGSMTHISYRSSSDPIYGSTVMGTTGYTGFRIARNAN